VASLNHGEGNHEAIRFGMAAEISDLLAVLGLNPEGGRCRPKLRTTEDTKMTVHVADTAQAGDHLLPDVTALG